MEENTKREHPGKIYTKLQEKEGSIVIGPGKTKTGSKPKEQQESLDYYMKKAKNIKKYYNKLKKYIDFSNEATKTTNKLPSSLPQNMTHRELLKLTDKSLTSQSPSVVIHLIEGDSNNPYPLNFTVYEISSDPSLNPNPVRFKIVPKSINRDPSLDLSFKQNANIDNDHLKLSIDNINLNNDMFSNKMPVNIKSGKASIVAEGNINSENVHLPLKISISDINARVEEGEKLFGLNSNIANQALQDIKELDLFFSLTGTLDKLQIESNTEQNIKNLQKAILKSGHKILGSKLKSQLKKFTKGNKSLEKITDDNSILEEGKDKVNDFLSNTDLSDLW